VAPNKQALLDSARNQVQKGNLPKAIKEYQKVMELGLGDVRVLLKIGDLQAKLGKDNDAVQTYILVAREHADGGFLPKAAAVYKRVLQLSPKLVEVHKSLAEIYHQLGLLSDAMAFYGSAGELLAERGDTDGSIEILQRMVMMDPENVGIYIKLAETLSRVGRAEEAVEVFAQAAALLEEAGRMDDWIKVVERQIYHDPEPDLVKRLVREYIDRRDGRVALAKLQIVYKDNHEDTECLGMLIEIFDLLEQPQKAHQVLREKARIHDKLGETVESHEDWERLLELVPEDHEALKALGRRKSRSAPLLSADILAPVIEPAGAHAPQVSPIPAHTPPPLPPLPPRPAFAPQPPPAQPPPQRAQPVPPPRPAWLTPEEIQRLLVETDVYIKYALFEKAQGHLDAVFAVEPNHVGALERLRTMRYTEGDYASASAVLLHLTRLVFPWDREQGLAYLREAYQCMPINEEANGVAYELGVTEHDLFPHQQGLEESFFDVLGDDVSLDSMLAQVAADYAPAVEEVGAVSLEQDEKYDTNVWKVEDLLQGEPHHDTDVFEVDELDDLDDLDALADLDHMGHAALELDAAADLALERLGGAAHDDDIIDVDVTGFGDIDEVDVYGLQPLPTGNASRAADNEPATAMVGVQGLGGVTAPALELPDGEEEEELEDLFLDDDEEEEEEEPAGSSPDELAMDLEEVDFYLDQGLHADALNMLREIATRWPAHPDVQRRQAAIAAAQAAAAEPARANGAAPGVSVHAAATADHPNPVMAAGGHSATTAEYGTTSGATYELPALPEGLIVPEATVPTFDLGVAFYEAGRYDEAMAELSAAIHAGEQVFPAMFLIAQMLLATEHWVDAAHFFHDALSYAERHGTMLPHVHYRLGIACHMAGNATAAREWYSHARAQGPELFPDLEGRMASL